MDGPVHYARTLEAVSTAVRAVDPSAELATGGVTSGNFTEYGGAFDRHFLPRVLAQLKQDNRLASVDYVTVHYYSSQFALYMNAGVDLIGRVSQLRQDMLAAGLTAAELKPVISDELSFTDLVGVSTSDSNDTFNLAQAAYVPKLFARSAAADVRIAFWFWMQDAAGGLGSDNTYGLKDATGTPKPAYRALRYFTSQIARRDQLARTLDLSAVGPGMEGYEFTALSGGSLQLVWANQVGPPAVAHEYFPVCPVVEVRDALGEPSAFNAETNSVMIAAEPRYILCSPSP